MRYSLIVCLLSVVISFAEESSAQLEDVFQWNLVSYDFSSSELAAENERQFRPENTVLTGLETSSDRVFLAAPRLRMGVAATLSTVPRFAPPGSSPALEPFPDWSWHGAGRGDLNCSGLISVYRVRSDSCGRLWVLDSGIMNSIDDFQRACNPKIIIFDMKTSRPIRSIRFPDELLRPNSLFTNLVIDETTSSPHAGCDDAFVYITDTAAPALIVYDSKADSAWRVTHAAMYPDPEFSMYRIGTDTFELMDGIVGLAFSPSQRTVYFQPLATDRTFSIPAEVLRQGPPADGEELPVTLVGRKSSQGIGLVIDPATDTLFYSPLTETAVASWNPHTNEHEVLAYDPEKIQFAAEVRWMADDAAPVWILTTRFHKFFLRTVSASDINIRVSKIRPNSHLYSAPPPPPPPQYYSAPRYDGYGGNRFYRQANATAGVY